MCDFRIIVSGTRVSAEYSIAVVCKKSNINHETTAIRWFANKVVENCSKAAVGNGQRQCVLQNSMLWRKWSSGCIVDTMISAMRTRKSQSYVDDILIFLLRDGNT